MTLEESLYNRYNPFTNSWTNIFRRNHETLQSWIFLLLRLCAVLGTWICVFTSTHSAFSKPFSTKIFSVLSLINIINWMLWYVNGRHQLFYFTAMSSPFPLTESECAMSAHLSSRKMKSSHSVINVRRGKGTGLPGVSVNIKEIRIPTQLSIIPVIGQFAHPLFSSGNEAGRSIAVFRCSEIPIRTALNSFTPHSLL